MVCVGTKTHIPSKDLDWSFDGMWVLVPTRQDDQGENMENYRIGRIESYIDMDGVIYWAIGYGENPESLNTWFRIEDLKYLFKKWKIPKESKFYNNRKFNIRTVKAATAAAALDPRDKSIKDIQGSSERRDNSYRYRENQDQSRERRSRAGRGGRKETDYEHIRRPGQQTVQNRDQDQNSQREYQNNEYRRNQSSHQRDWEQNPRGNSTIRKRERSPSPRGRRTEPQRVYFNQRNEPQRELYDQRRQDYNNQRFENREDRTDRGNRYGKGA